MFLTVFLFLQAFISTPPVLRRVTLLLLCPPDLRGVSESCFTNPDFMYIKKENARRSSSWELTPPRQPQTVNYREAYMSPAFPRGHQTVGRGSVKLGPRSLHFRSASALLFRRVGSIPRRLQGGCSGLCELSCLF